MHRHIVGSMEFGLLHPGEMGAAVGKVLTDAGHGVLWLAEGRSTETISRAKDARLQAAGSLEALLESCDVVLSICPPHAAIDVAQQVSSAVVPFRGIYLDANAVSPTTAETIASIVCRGGASYVDGGIIGTPPLEEGARLYVSGASASNFIARCGGIALEVVDLGDGRTAASAIKMAYAAWTKGTSALLLAISALAAEHGVEEALVAEWALSQPGLATRRDRSARAALAKGWRWTGEMDEIGAAFAGVGLPDGFGSAAAEVYRRVPRRTPTNDSGDLEAVLSDLTIKRHSKPSS